MGLENLLNPIADAYGKSATGFDYGVVRDSLKEDRDYKRGEVKSFFDITADLDAAAFSAAQSQFDEIKTKIENNELKVGTPEFKAATSKFGSIARGLKEVQDLQKKVTTSFASDPDKFAYLTGKQFFEADEGYQGYIRDMSEVSSKKYETPEEYIAAVTSTLGKAQSKIDERLVAQDLEKIIDDEVKNAIEGTTLSGQKIPKLTVGNKVYYEVPVEMADAIKRAQTRFKTTYPNASRQLAARDRSKGLVTIQDNNTYMDGIIENIFPKYLKQYEGAVPTPRVTTPKPAFTPEQEVAAKDVKQDVADAQASNNPASIEKYVSAAGFFTEYKDGKFHFYKKNEVGTGDNRIVGRKDITVIDANDAVAIYDFISRANKNIPRAAIDQAGDPSAQEGTETPQQKSQRLKEESKLRQAQTDVTRLFKAGTGEEGAPMTGKKNDIPIKPEEYIKMLSSKYDMDGVVIDAGNNGIRTITIDGTEYDMSNKAQAEKAFTALQNKFLGKTPTTGVGSKYNK